MNITINQFRKIILATQQYELNLVNKELIFVFDNGDSIYEYHKCRFGRRNFLHLTGVKTKLRADAFYEKALNGELLHSDCLIKEDGTTELKIEALTHLVNLPKRARYICQYNHSKRNLMASIVCGDETYTIAFVDEGDYLVPCSLLMNSIYGLGDIVKNIIAIYIREQDGKISKTWSSKLLEEDRLPNYLTNRTNGIS